MDTNTELKLGFGRRTYPKDVRAVWGARLIWPDDFLHDRQDLDAQNDEAKALLIHWLNGADDTGKDGAIARMRKVLADANQRAAKNIWRSMEFGEEAIIYADEDGVIVGSTQGASGYVYVAGWLFIHTEDQRGR